MIEYYPDNFAFVMGYANMLSNDTQYEEASDYYAKVSDIKPNWTKPVECRAYIY